MNNSYAGRSRRNGNEKANVVEIDVEQLMQEIDRRAERQRQSLAPGTVVAANQQMKGAGRGAAKAEYSATGMEQCLHEALDAQVALNASIVESLARLDHAYREAQCLQAALSQKVALHERVQPRLADEMAGLREEVDRLEEMTERLRRSTLGLMRLVRETRKQGTGEPGQLEARVQALEQAVRSLHDNS